MKSSEPAPLRTVLIIEEVPPPEAMRRAELWRWAESPRCCRCHWPHLSVSVLSPLCTICQGLMHVLSAGKAVAHG